MEKRRRSYQKRSVEQWGQLVADQRSSGQSVCGFARSRGICVSSLGHWSRRLRCDDGTALAEAERAVPGDGVGGGGLVELVAKRQLIGVETSGGDVHLLVGSAVCLQLSQLPSPEYLALVAHAYEAVSS
jgi:transposase-like protein